MSTYLNSFEERFKRHRDLLDDLSITYQQKNTAYGDSFHDTYADLGIIAAATRISDKFNRFKNLAKDKNNNIDIGDESITDTLLDMANYCLLTVMEIERERAAAEKDPQEEKLEKLDEAIKAIEED